MNSKKFWEIIGEARMQASGWEEMMEPLVSMLEQLEEAEIFHWQLIFEEYQHLSRKNKLWAAAYVINGGCSDDGFDYFRAWLTAQGKEICIKSLYDPESLATLDMVEYAEFEDIMSAASTAYFKKLGISPDYDRYYNEHSKYSLTDAQRDEIAIEIKYASDIDTDWKENNLKEWLPKLCEKYAW
ncbi:MAG: DUF4240 domain-containing protein [Defluviitaleaceae bacterium]|nr:DUF4240 domain-containing protein [Defluviitaleaceae bacterium]